MGLSQEGRQLSISTPLGDDFLLIRRFRAYEGLSKLFTLELELLHEENDEGSEPTIVEVDKILGQAVSLNVTQKDGTTRQINGVINQFQQGNRDTRFSHYQAVVVPAVWLLTQKFQSRIFQQINVPDILKKVFEGFDVKFEFQSTYEQRNYCVQYQETDFDFASRLMEEEGIYYFFEHTDGNHKMIVGDSPQSHRDCPTKETIACFLDVTDQEDFVSSISTWRIKHQLQSGKFTLWDYNFQKPKNKLDAEQPSRIDIGGNQELEIYEYAAGHARKFDGIDKSGGEQPSELQKVFEEKTRTAKIRMEQFDSQYKTVNAISDCCSITAGHRFTLTSHPNTSQNAQHIIVSIEHQGAQSPEYISGEEPEDSYLNEFVCIPYGAGNAPYRPPRNTAKPIIRGSQTAFVVGPSGEEIFTDKFGRVKVQFNWDREGQVDASSSCWIRVAQSWAGNRWGMMFIPRIGMEVIVDFLEGNPDEPIIRGCVYNPEAMPPYTLPDEKTKMTIKSDSTTGGDGFNELRFEDKKGSEQIFIHGEKDLDVRIKNDSREWTGNDQHEIVKRDRRKLIERDEHQNIKRDLIEKIERDHHKTVSGKEAVSIGGSLSLKVTGDVIEEFKANHSEETTGNLYLKGMNVVMEGMTGLTIKVGGSFVTINPAGVQISGPMVMINSGGSALSGSAGSLVSPMAPSIADKADDAKPGTKMTLEKRSANRKEKTHKENDPKKKSWIKLKMVDEAGKPVTGLSYRVTAPDGRVASGTTNEKGEAEVKNIDPGSCKISFPTLDQEAWEEG